MTWQEELEKIVYPLFKGGACTRFSDFMKFVEIKNFIQKTREDAVREALEKVEAEVNGYKDGYMCGGRNPKANGFGYKLAMERAISIINKHKNI